MTDQEDPNDRAPRVRTITDLARLAGVTAGTVSRALAGTGHVSDRTRQRIRKLADEHSFRPNQMASRLRTRRTGVIGVVVPLGHERRQHISDPFFMSLLGHLADGLTEAGYDLMLSRIIPDADDWLERIVTSGMLDGIMLIGQSDQFDTIERVANGYLPLVAWGSTMPGQRHCAIGVANRTGGRLAATHLIARGCRRLAFLGEVRTLELIERHRGVCDALAAARLPQPLQLDTHLASDVMADEIAAHIDRLLAEVDGIVAASDVIAMRTIRSLADRGIAVPNRIAVTGFDDLPLAQSFVPRLTTVRQDLPSGARMMIDALFRRIAGEAAQSVEMTPDLILRDSA